MALAFSLRTTYESGSFELRPLFAGDLNVRAVYLSIIPFSPVSELCSFKKPFYNLGAMSAVLCRICCTLRQMFAHNTLLKVNEQQTRLLTLCSILSTLKTIET